LRLVLDTDVVVAAVRSDQGASRQLLLAALDRRIVVLASVPLMIEYEAVLKRPQHLAAMGLAVDEVDVILDALAAIVERVRLTFLWRPSLVDPNDEMVLDTAVNGGADRLVTFNVRHFEEAAGRFGLKVSAPGATWRKLEGRNHETK